MIIDDVSNHISEGAKHIWLPYAQMQNHLPQLEIQTAKGSEIFLKNGQVLIDGISSWWAAAHGYNHPHLTQALVKQAQELPHIMLAGFAHEQTYKLAHRLAKFTGLQHIFFSDSGSTAVEVAMKICLQYHANLGQTKKTKFVSFKNSYHGDTTGAMSLADLSSGMHKKFQGILLDNFSVNLPKNQNDLKCLLETRHEGSAEALRGSPLHISQSPDLNAFEEFIKKHKSEIAGIFIEPIIQCAGGMVFHSAEILREIFDIAKKHEILFVADECATGFYRTGKKFACDHAKITPDIMILGKALTGGCLTLSATCVNEKIFEAFLGDSIDKALMHGPTFMGNPLACAAANASLDLFETENYAAMVLKQEKFVRQELEKYREFKNVLDVRTLGAVGVVETNLQFEDMMFLRKEFVKQGVFLRPFAGVIYLMPALNIKKDELQKITDVIYKTLSNLTAAKR